MLTSSRSAGALLFSLIALGLPPGSAAARAQGSVNAQELAVETDSSALLSNQAAFTADFGNTPAAATSSIANDCREQYRRATASLPSGSPPLVSFGCVFKRLHLDTPARANEFFGGFKVGNSIALATGGDQAALYTELLSDNLFLSAGLGYARIGLSAQVSSASDTGATTVEQLFQGGGNAVLYAALPLAVWINFIREGDTISARPVRRFNSYMSLAFGADIPELSVVAADNAMNLRLGLQSDFTWRTHNEDFRFFALSNGGYVVGLSDKFYENLTGGTDDAPKAGFLMARATVGVELAKLVKVGVSFGASTMSSVNHGARLSIEMVPRSK